MPKGDNTKPPMCKLCRTEHWSYERHSYNVIDVIAKLLDEPEKSMLGTKESNEATSPTVQKPKRIKRASLSSSKGGRRVGAGRPKKAI